MRKGAEDDLIFYSQKIEKRISYPVVLDPTLDDRIKLENLYIGSMNMDETMSQDEIVAVVLYIPSGQAEEYAKEYLGTHWSSELQLSDIISDIFCEADELKEKILRNHMLYPGDIEGKGEWENDFVKITDLTGEVLFEGGAY